MSDKVISLFAERAKKEKEAETKEASKEDGYDFETVSKHNEINSERVKRERANANKSVLRSYRIKH